jgi:hypothetical protein
MLFLSMAKSPKHIPSLNQADKHKITLSNIGLKPPHPSNAFHHTTEEIGPHSFFPPFLALRLGFLLKLICQFFTCVKLKFLKI